MKLLNALYIVNYHDVSWEDSLLTQSLNGNIRPDIFRCHLEFYRAHGDLISIQDAIEHLKNHREFRKPTFSLWFDDGLAGAFRHAYPICREFGITAAQSVNSRFMNREELFYLNKVSFLNMTDGLRYLRSALRREFPGVPLKMRGWLKTEFRSTMVPIINEVFERFTSSSFRNDCARLYSTPEEIAQLHRSGWLITNHTSAHYPMSESRCWEEIKEDCRQCQESLEPFIDSEPRIVIPFGFLPSAHQTQVGRLGQVVLVSGKTNSAETFATGLIFRHDSGRRRRPCLG